MFGIGDLLELADTAAARVGIVVVGILAVLAFALEGSGLLDLSEFITTYPVLALTAGIIGAVGIGASAALCLCYEPMNDAPNAPNVASARTPARDVFPESPSLEAQPSFCERLAARRLGMDDRRSRGDL
jgi:hypothetical protein